MLPLRLSSQMLSRTQMDRRVMSLIFLKGKLSSKNSWKSLKITGNKRDCNWEVTISDPTSGSRKCRSLRVVASVSTYSVKKTTSIIWKSSLVQTLTTLSLLCSPLQTRFPATRGAWWCCKQINWQTATYRGLNAFTNTNTSFAKLSPN